MKLYSVHCGFYDKTVGDGIYEFHVNLFVAAESFGEAKKKAKAHPSYKDRRMHVDGIQELSVVDGYKIELKASVGEGDVVKTMDYEGLKTLKTEELSN